MTRRPRRGHDEPLPVRAARQRDQHRAQVTSYGFFAGRGPKRSVTVTPAPLRYWQYDPPRAFVVVLVAIGLGVWIAYGNAEVPVAVFLAVLVLAGSTGRLTVSDAALSTDIAGLRQTSSFGIVPRALVREIVAGRAPAGWPRTRRRGGWWPGRARVAVRWVRGDGEQERALTVWVRDPNAFADALGRPLP